MTGDPAVSHLVIGPPEHGVVRFGRRLAEFARAECLTLPTAQTHETSDPVATADLDAVLDRLRRGTGPVHLQYTEALYGSDTTRAAEAFVRLSERITGATGRPISVTLHDLPDPADEPGRYRRRSLGYGRVVGQVDAVAVSSEHEAALLQKLTDATAAPARPVRVIPLPIRKPLPTAVGDRPVPRPEVAVFGFIYPGKGHEDVLEALSGLPPQVGLTALGRVADGHEELARRLADRAHLLGRRLMMTGFIADADLDDRLRRCAVPVVPATSVSASGSLNSWISAGRRPLVADLPYTRDFARSCPGTVTLYGPGELGPAMAEILSRPDLSWLSQPPPGQREEQPVADSYTRFLAEVAAGPVRP